MNPDNTQHETCGAFGLNKTVCVLDKGHAGKHDYQSLERVPVRDTTPELAQETGVRSGPLAPLVVAATVAAALAPRKYEYKVPSTISNKQRSKRKKAMKAARQSRRRNRAR